MKLWRDRNIADLTDGRAIQCGLTSMVKKNSMKHPGSSFAKLMMEGKVRAVLRLLSNQDDAGPLSLDTAIGSESCYMANILPANQPTPLP